MHWFGKAFLLVILALAAPATAFTQTKPKPESQDPERLVIERSEVVLDAVVKDKKGRPVTTLTAADFLVFEDGVQQQLSSFRLVRRKALRESTKGEKPAPTKKETAPATAASTAKPISGNSPSELVAQRGAIALVFDRLSPDARSRAHAAAVSYISQGLTPDDYIGVFSIDQTLKVLQPFTNDPALIRRAIDQAAKQGSSTYTDRTEQITELSKQYHSLVVADDQFKSGIADTLNSQGRRDEARNVLNQPPEHTFEQMTLAASITTAEGFEKLERDVQGYATTDSLLAIIDGMSRLPRRKLLLFFSEGVAVTSNTADNFRAVISNANRASVSVYPVDAAGLRVENTNVILGQAMTALGQRRAQQASHGGDASLEAMTKDLERNEDLVRRNPVSSLGQLADQTGGVLVNSTNDPGERLRQVNDDLSSYYLLTYSPQNKNYNGVFRQTSIRVSRPGLETQSRKGYFALPETYDSPVLAYEAPGLAILGGQPSPNSFETRSAAFSFPEPQRPGLVPLVVEIPAGAINYLVDNAKTTYRSDFSVVVLIKNEAQRVVRKLSSHYLLNGPFEKLDTALNGGILFYKETDLWPGNYTISAIVFDSLANRSSLSNSALSVPVSDTAQMQLSSLVLLKSSEHLSSSDRNASRLFRVGDVILYPRLKQTISKSEDPQLRLFLNVFAAPDLKTGKAPSLSMEVLQQDRVLGQIITELPGADEAGRRQYTGTISVGTFPAGEYELRATVTDGAGKATRSARFTVQP